MSNLKLNNKVNLFRRVVSILIVASFLSTSVVPVPYVQAQTVVNTAGLGLNLPLPGTLVQPTAEFSPPLVTGITFYPDDPMKFDFIIDIGDDKIQGEDLREESKKLINYFLATLTVPEDELWVNLSPYEEDRIIPEGLGVTEMGRDLLAQDYLLKQLTASLMYPEKELGKEFWNKIYAKVGDEVDLTKLSAETFNKVWIVPDLAEVYVNASSVFVARSHLKVMLEEDYIAMSAQGSEVSGQPQSTDHQNH